MWICDKKVKWTKIIMKKHVVIEIEVDPADHSCCKSIVYIHSMSVLVGIRPDILCKYGDSQYCELFKKNLRTNEFKVFRCKDCKKAEKGVIQ